jgi:phosphoglycerate dehydrogenase-like enzyme
MGTGSLRVLSHVPVAILKRAEQELPGVELIGVPGEGEIPPPIAGEVLLTYTWGAPNLKHVAKRGVRWIHAFGTGVDRFPFDALGDRILTCSRGASDVPISEWVLAVMLAFEKRLPSAWVREPPERWNFADLGGLHGRTLGLVGLGGIGSAVASRALPFGMRVRALRRTRRPSPIPGVEMARDLDDLLESADHLVLAASATAATRHLIDRSSLKCIKRGVHLVNIARGSLVDQKALREALDDGRVALASLDTVDPEPLPAGHWLYTHPKVRVSPHTSWSMPGAIDRLLDPFIANLRRFQAGDDLAGMVDPEAGY